MQPARQRFEQYLKRQFGQTSTFKHYQSDLRCFERYLGEYTPEGVSAATIDGFIDSQIARGLSPASINRRLASLHAYFEYVAGERPERGWPNPVVWRRHRLKTGTHLPRDVLDEVVERLLAVIGSARDQAMFGLMVGAGLRVGEVVTVQLSDLEPPTEAGQLARVRVLGKGHKERIVWLGHALWETLQAWLTVRPPVASRALFVNGHGQPLSVAGVQYRLKQHCQAAQVNVSCHRLRHTFARRLVEHGLPVESLARLLGHSQLHTTQRYIDGADPSLRRDFQQAMAQLDSVFSRQRTTPPPAPPPKPPATPSRQAPRAKLAILRDRLTRFPPWLAEMLDAYLSWRWSTWRSQTAYIMGQNLIGLVHRVWRGLTARRPIAGWSDLRRVDLETWLHSRSQAGGSSATLQNELNQFRSVLKFAETRGYPLDPGLFRIKAPKTGSTLPRYLPEADYRRLEMTILTATANDTYDARFDRAWFLSLAHTGLRLSELLDWRVGDVQLSRSIATVRGAKADRDRVVYLTAALQRALAQYLAVRPTLPKEDHLFLLHNRVPCTRTIQMRLAAYGRQVGLAVTPHQLRHTLATRLINQGMPMVSLSKLLGHRHLNTTQIYAHVYDETLYQQFQATMSSLAAIAVDN